MTAIAETGRAAQQQTGEIGEYEHNPQQRLAQAFANAAELLELSDITPEECAEYASKVISLVIALRNVPSYEHGRDITRRKEILEEYGVTTLYELGARHEQIQSAVLFWLPEGGAWGGKRERPHTISFMRTKTNKIDFDKIFATEEVWVANVPIGGTRFKFLELKKLNADIDIERSRVVIGDTFKAHTK